VRLGELAPTTHALVTLGGNDAGFADALARCVIGSCLGAVAQRSAALPALGARLEAAFRQIAAAAPGGRALVVGYSEIVPERPPSGFRCLWLSDAEVAAALAFNRALNATLEAAAGRAGAEFVPIGDA